MEQKIIKKFFQELRLQNPFSVFFHQAESSIFKKSSSEKSKENHRFSKIFSGSCLNLGPDLMNLWERISRFQDSQEV